MRRLTRGRAATDVEATPQGSAASQPVGAPTDAQQGDSVLPPDGQSQRTELLTPVTPEANTSVAPEPNAAVTPEATAADPALPPTDLPAGVDAAELAAAPETSARRGRLRRRLRYLRAVRELLLRDLGGFVHEAQRGERGIDGHRALLEVKSRRLSALEAEVRALEEHLGQPHPRTLLRRPGVGGNCPECGELHPSDARFCARCGTPLTGRAARTRPAGTPTAGTLSAVGAADDPKASTASLWGRPKRLSPAIGGDAPTQAGVAASDASPEQSTATSGDALRAATPPVARRAGGAAEDGAGEASPAKAAPAGAGEPAARAAADTDAPDAGARSERR